MIKQQRLSGTFIASIVLAVSLVLFPGTALALDWMPRKPFLSVHRGQLDLTAEAAPHRHRRGADSSYWKK